MVFLFASGCVGLFLHIFITVAFPWEAVSKGIPQPEPCPGPNTPWVLPTSPGGANLPASEVPEGSWLPSALLRGVGQGWGLGAQPRPCSTPQDPVGSPGDATELVGTEECECGHPTNSQLWCLVPCGAGCWEGGTGQECRVLPAPLLLPLTVGVPGFGGLGSALLLPLPGGGQLEAVWLQGSRQEVWLLQGRASLQLP